MIVYHPFEIAIKFFIVSIFWVLSCFSGMYYYLYTKQDVAAAYWTEGAWMLPFGSFLYLSIDYFFLKKHCSKYFYFIVLCGLSVLLVYYVSLLLFINVACLFIC